MRKISWLLAFLLLSLNLPAQITGSDKKYLDSLNQLAARTISDSIKAHLYFKISDFWVDRDTVKTKAYLEKGKGYAHKYPFLRGRYHYLLGDYYASTDAAKSEASYLRADKELAALTSKAAYRQRTMLWHNYALLYQHKDEIKTTLNVLINRVLPLAKKAGDEILVGTEYISIATLFINLKQYDKAALYSGQGIAYFEHTPPDQNYLKINAYLTTAESYYHLEKYPAAKKYFDLAKKLLNGSVNVVSHANLDIFWLNYHQIFAWYLKATKQQQEALLNIEKGTILAKKLGNDYILQALGFDKYEILFEQKKYAAAEKLLLELVKKEEINKLASNRLINADKLANFYATTGNMAEAYRWLKRSKHLGDSLSESRIKADMNTLEIKYRTAENKKKIAALNAAQKQHLLSLKNQRLTNWLLVAATIFLLALAGFIFFYYRNYKRLATEREINLKQKSEALEQKQQIEVTKAMLDAEEKERNRVARDLHDGLGGMLAGVKINLSSWAKHNDNMETHDFELQRIINQLDGSVNELRNIARNMMPQTLLEYGLEAALKELCESVMAKDIDVDFQPINIGRNIGLSQQIGIYRIVQEVIANVLKHAGATEILLQCSQNQNRFYITAEDNGKGLDVKSLNKKSGMGIGNIRNRVEYLNGTFDISSSLDEGTIINIELDV
ncbi:sensor histidine kinase [Pedobacter sp. GSP4]|uniref:sensor histidine kinase n=1 Tax=Pedobacter sp. GSP4 TaxID=3453716 RepID=UPI003EEF1E75